MNRVSTALSSPSRRPAAAPLRRINEETTLSSTSLSSSPPKARTQVSNEGNKSFPSLSTPHGARSLPASPVSTSQSTTTGSPRRRHRAKTVTPLESRQDDISTAGSSSAVAAAAASAEESVHEMEHENQTLEEQCEDLEETLIRLRQDGNVFKMKTSLSVSSYQTTIDRLTSETNQLQRQCLVLEQQLDDLRIQNAAKQLEIMTMEDDLNRTEI